MRFPLPRPSLFPSARTTPFAGWLVAVAALASSAVVRAEPLRLPISTRMEASATWAENIARSSSPSNWLDGVRQDARFTASMLTPVVTGVSVITEADAGYETMPRFQRNTAFTGGLRSGVRWKFGLGAFAPVLSSEVGITRRDARMSGDNGWLATGAVHLSKRFSDSWRASLTGDWSQHYAAHAPFDVRHHRVLGTLTYDLNDTWQLTYGRGSLFGDFTAHAGPAIWARALAGLISPAIGQYYNTISWETTDSYGSGWVTYRVTGRSDFWWLELAPAIGRNTSLPLRYESTYTVNRVGVQYRQDLWTLGVLHRF
ncbi:MAG: hypothetical protein NTV51_23930 [Verrucomicrobia bacterium]|nr:hypothetical protein [Verrucomicrobiota bacterium]